MILWDTYLHCWFQNIFPAVKMHCSPLKNSHFAQSETCQILKVFEFCMLRTTYFSSSSTRNMFFSHITKSPGMSARFWAKNWYLLSPKLPRVTEQHPLSALHFGQTNQKLALDSEPPRFCEIFKYVTDRNVAGSFMPVDDLARRWLQ